MADQEAMYKESDFVLVTSLDESFGLVIIEAFSYGIPVISSDNMGAKEIIKHKHTGLLYTYGFDNELSENILYLLDNPNIKRALIDNAYDEVIEKYDIDVVSKNIESVVKNTIAMVDGKG